MLVQHERHVPSDYSWTSCKQWMQKINISEFADFVEARKGYKELEWSRERVLVFVEDNG